MLKNNPFSNYRSSAFTLMEILITVIIVGIIASFAFSKYSIVVEAQRAKEGEQALLTTLASYKRDRMEKTSVTCSSISDLNVKPINFTAPTAGGQTNPNGDYFCYYMVQRRGTASAVYQVTINSQCGMGQANVMVNAPYVLYIVDEYCVPTQTKVNCVSGQSNYCSQLGY